VENRLIGATCLNDLIEESCPIGGDWDNRGEYKADCLIPLLRDLRKAGDITGREKGKLGSCSNRAYRMMNRRR
jgi:hypothetical protein